MAFTKVVGPGIHTLSNIASHNINSSGIITATQFDGPFSNVVVGGATTLTVDGINISAGILTAQTLDLNGNGDISGNLVVGGNLTANGDFTTLNTTLREVELLRVDANNDSAIAGIITQSGSGHALYVDGTTILGNSQYVPTFLAATQLAVANLSGNSNSVDVTILGGRAGKSIIRFGDHDSNNRGSIQYHHTDESINFYNNGNTTTPRLTIATDGTVGIGSATPLSSMALDVIGSIRYSGQSRGANGTNAEPSYAFYADHDSGMYRGGTNILSFATAGIKRVTVLADGKVGIGSGTPSALLDVNKGTQANIQLKTTDSGSINSMVFAIGSSTNQIYSRGANSSTARNLIFLQGSTEVLKIDTLGNLILKDTLAQGNSLVNYIQGTDVNAASQYYFGMLSTGNQDVYVTNSKNANLRFQTNGSTRWKIDGDPGHLLPETAGAVNIGSASVGIGSVYLADDKKLYLGSSQDVEIYHSSGNVTMFDSPTNRQVQLKGDGGLLIRAGGNQNIANFVQSAVTLYHNVGNLATIRLTTTSTGITVGGEVAATQDYPVVKPTLDLNFAGTANLDPRVTFTRVGSGSYYGRDGLLKFAAHNEPRFDHDPITRECKGLLIEEERQNWAYNSYRANNDYGGGGATYDDMGYNMINNAVTINDFGTAPDGTNTATKMYPASNGNGRGIELQMSLNSTGNWTNSIYVKAAGHTGWIALYGVNGSTRAYFNPTTGAMGSSSQSSVPNAGKYGIQDVGNGWYRIHLTVNLTTTSGTEYHYIYFGDADGSTIVTSSGTNGILMWGLQVEKGDFPTSYIRTDSTHRVTRAADECYIDGQDFLDFYNQTEGTMISSHSILSDEISSSHNLYTYQISPTGATTYAPLRLLDRNASYGNSLTAASVYNNGSVFLVQDTGSPATVAGRKYKVAVSIKKDDYDAVFNGGTLQSDGSGDLYTADHISIGYYKPTPQAYLNGHIQRLTYYPFKLTDNQLKTVTS